MGSALDQENDIRTYDAAPEPVEGVIVFGSQKEFTKATAEWPASRFVELWNSFAGTPGPYAKLKEVKKFTDRQTAINRIWNILNMCQPNAPTWEDVQQAVEAKKAAQGAPKKETATTLPAGQEDAPKGRKTAKKSEPRKAAKKPGKTAAEPREGSKKATVIAMLERKGGASLEEIMKTTAWQPHTVRGFISILGKGGVKVESTKNDAGLRTYHIDRK